jgi:hypothetical protein
MPTTTSDVSPDNELQSRDLPSGRSVVVRVSGVAEEIEVRSASGDVEVRITLTDAGPVVQLRGANLQLEAPESVELKCKRLFVHTSEATNMQSAGEINIHADGDMDLRGKVLKLNC